MRVPMSDSREEESVSVRGRVLPLRQWEAEALVHAAVCAALFRGYWLVSLGFNLGAVKQFPVRYPVLEVLREETQLLVAVGSVYVALACGLCVRIRAARYLLVVGDVVAWAALAVLFSRGAGPTSTHAVPL